MPHEGLLAHRDTSAGLRRHIPSAAQGLSQPPRPGHPENPRASTARHVRRGLRKNWPGIRNNLSMQQLRQKGAEKQEKGRCQCQERAREKTPNRGSKPAESRRPNQERSGDTTKSGCRLRQKTQTQGATRRHGLFRGTFQDRARVFPGEGRMRCAARS